MNDIVHRLLNWEDDTVVMEVRQTAEDIQKLMDEGAEEIDRVRFELNEARNLLIDVRDFLRPHEFECPRSRDDFECLCGLSSMKSRIMEWLDEQNRTA